MVDGTSPTYHEGHYAEPSYYEFGVYGKGLNLLPDDCVGILATDNDNPLENIESTAADRLEVLVSKTYNSAVFRYASQHWVNANLYLGAIVSADRSTIYWTNTSKPLPTT